MGILDDIFRPVENVVEGAEQALKRNRRQWWSVREPIGFVLHSFNGEDSIAECEMIFPADGERMTPRGEGRQLTCVRCLLIRCGE